MTLRVGVDTAPPKTFGEREKEVPAVLTPRPITTRGAVPGRGRSGTGNAPPHEMAPGLGK